MELFKKHWKILVIVLLAGLWINSCTSSSSANREVRKLRVENDSLKSEIVEAIQFKNEDLKQLQIMYQIETLKSEKRSVLNINQIFLRQTRPDKRVIEIDNEIKALEEKLN